MSEDLSARTGDDDRTQEQAAAGRRLYLVTSNEAKYRAAVDVLAPEFELERATLDIPEIQSTDPEAVVEAKAEAAYATLGKPVLVDDFSFFIDGLNDFPGPLVKHLLKETGLRGLEGLYGVGGSVCTLRCTVATYDGDEWVRAHGELRGTLEMATEYVDPSSDMLLSTVFVPVGQELPLSELQIAGHRERAYANLKDRLNAPEGDP